jgi:hypothetical protein
MYFHSFLAHQCRVGPARGQWEQVNNTWPPAANFTSTTDTDISSASSLGEVGFKTLDAQAYFSYDLGGGGWWWVVCKPILVFSFGPNQALGLGLRLGPIRTKTWYYYTIQNLAPSLTPIYFLIIGNSGHTGGIVAIVWSVLPQKSKVSNLLKKNIHLCNKI